MDIPGCGYCISSSIIIPPNNNIDAAFDASIIDIYLIAAVCAAIICL